MGLLGRLAGGWRREQRCVWRAAAALGENPIWSEPAQALYWIDIPAGILHRWMPESGAQRSWQVARELQAMALDLAGRPVVVTGDRFCRVDTDTGGSIEIARLPDLGPRCRYNDGACDATGRLWLGSMDRQGSEPLGRLFRFDPGRGAQIVDDGYRISNGPAFAADSSRLYIADSPRRVIYVMDLTADGSLAAKRVFTAFAESDGYPDGMTVDAEDHLWVAHYDGWKVTRFDPTGAPVQSIRLPVARVTACSFGGADLRTLYVTSARAGLDPAALRQQPLAGGLFALPAEVAGRPAWRLSDPVA